MKKGSRSYTVSSLVIIILPFSINKDIFRCTVMKAMRYKNYLKSSLSGGIIPKLSYF